MTRHHDHVHANTLQIPKTRSPWMARGLCLALILSLCATNILVLFDHEFRKNAYDAVTRFASPALAAVGMASAATKLSENGPAALEKKAIERATAELVARNALLLRDVQSLTQVRDSLIVQRAKLDKQFRASQVALANHKDRVSRLGKSVVSRAGRGVIRHLGALPGHALPVLSATVAVGSVALDIRDACESIKELDELNRSVGLPLADRSQVCGKTVPSAQELLDGARGNWEAVYRNSAAALNSGAKMISATPPVSRQFARQWLSGIVPSLQ